MSKQAALEYAEAKLAELVGDFEYFEKEYGENLKDVYEIIPDIEAKDEIYSIGAFHGGVKESIGVLRQIIVLLGQERE